MDLFSRRVGGWLLGASMEASLVLKALNRALGQRLPGTAGAHGISCSMSAKVCCWDNAGVESFFSTLKHELDLDDDAETCISSRQLQRDLAFWIDGYNNRERRHSTLSYLSPIDYDQKFITALTLTHADP